MKIYSQEYFLRKILDCTEIELNTALLLKHILCEATQIPKKGGYRSIVSVKSNSVLIKLHKNLQKYFFSKLPVSVAAKGFIKGCSYADFLEEHIGHEYFLRLDIKDFFDSITKESVIVGLDSFAEKEIVESIAELCTWNERVPQGFVTSPAISNLIFRRLDQRIRKYCRSYQKEMKRTIFYTRYADDMLFSSIGFDFKKNKNFKRMIVHILEENGFKCNESKTIYSRGEISLSGYVIKEDVHLSRKKLRNINEVIYQFDNRNCYKDREFGLDKETIDIKKILTTLNTKALKKADGTSIQFAKVSSLVHYLAGWRSYLIQIARVEHGNTGYDKQISRKINKIEQILDYLSELPEEFESGSNEVVSTDKNAKNEGI